jgi:hypothetical protein
LGWEELIWGISVKEIFLPGLGGSFVKVAVFLAEIIQEVLEGLLILIPVVSEGKKAKN